MILRLRDAACQFNGPISLRCPPLGDQTNWVYELPLGHGKPFLSKGIGGKVLGNWQISGILAAQTGTPLAISRAGDVVWVDARERHAVNPRVVHRRYL